MAAAVVAGALLAAPASAPAALETVLQDDANLIYRPTDQVREAMAQIRALGVDRVRLTAIWSVLTRDADAAVEPAGFDARDPAAYEQPRWRALDQAVTLAREAGLDVLVDVGFFAPRWATTSPPGGRARDNVSPRAFADFAVAVARRYSGRFTPAPDVAAAPAPAPSEDETLLDALLGGGQRPAVAPAPDPGEPLDRVDEFALWNEPNHPAFLLPQWRGSRAASPTVYRRMVAAAYPAAKRARPDALFLVGNTSSMGTVGHGAVAPLRFVRELACVDRALRPRTRGACAHFTRVPGDGWAHHPYNRNLRPDARSPASQPDDVWIGDLPELSRLLRRLAARGRIAPALRRIHVTEFGYETRAIGTRPRVSPADQARWLTWAEYLADHVPGVVSFAQFLLRDQPPAPIRVSDSVNRPYGQFYTGLQTADGVAKPAARSFVAGLFARARRDGTVLLWGRLRLGAGPRTVTIERARPGGRWARLLTVHAPGDGTFARRVRGVPGARYRLRAPGVTGVPVAARP